jgi:hypothetical protein
MVNILSSTELQSIYSAVLASYPTDAKIYESTVSNPNFNTANPKQDTFSCRVEYVGTQRELKESTDTYIWVQTWKAFIPKYVNPGVPTSANDPTTGDWFLALGYRFRVESIETPYTHAFSKEVNLRWLSSDSTNYGTYIFDGEAPFDVLLTESLENILTEDGNLIAL